MSLPPRSEQQKPTHLLKYTQHPPFQTASWPLRVSLAIIFSPFVFLRPNDVLYVCSFLFCKLWIERMSESQTEHTVYLKGEWDRRELCLGKEQWRNLLKSCRYWSVRPLPLRVLSTALMDVFPRIAMANRQGWFNRKDIWERAADKQPPFPRLLWHYT